MDFKLIDPATAPLNFRGLIDNDLSPTRARPLNETSGRVLVQLTMGEQKDAFALAEGWEKLSPTDTGSMKHTPQGASPVAQIMQSRLPEDLRSAYDKITPGVRIFASILAGGSPGNAVHWAFTLSVCYWLCVKDRIATLNMNRLGLFFPWGFPGDEQASRIWDKQKMDPDTRKALAGKDGVGSIPPDNYLDYPEFWAGVREDILGEDWERETRMLSNGWTSP